MPVSSTSHPSFIQLTERSAVQAPRPPQRIAFVTPEQRAARSPFSKVHKPINFATCGVTAGMVKGTLIRTSQGDMPIESLNVGDHVVTADHGALEIAWINKMDQPASPAAAAVHIKDGALGNVGDLIVSPDFRVLLQGWRSTKVAGVDEVLTAAEHLVNDRDILRLAPVPVTYYHIAFDKHEVIFANGMPVESLHPEIPPVKSLPDDIRQQLRWAVEGVKRQAKRYGPLTRPEVKPYEARLIRP